MPRGFDAYYAFSNLSQDDLSAAESLKILLRNERKINNSPNPILGRELALMLFAEGFAQIKSDLDIRRLVHYLRRIGSLQSRQDRTDTSGR